MDLTFYSAGFKGEIKFPCVFIKRTEWDDANYKTLFELVYAQDGLDLNRLGFVKIGVKGQKPGRTPIPDSFDYLSDEYISLGQSRKFYSLMYSLPNKVGWQILKCIGDLRAIPERLSYFRSEPVFWLSISRSLGAFQLAMKGERQIFGRRKKTPTIGVQSSSLEKSFTEDFVVEFSCRLQGSARRVECRFVFSDSEFIPGRTNVLVGRNGVGKTQLLASLVGVITGIDQAGYVSESRAQISKVFAVSYSVFDKFFMPNDIKVPRSDRRKDFLLNSAKYEYIGIRESNNNNNSYRVLGSTSLSRKFTDAVQKIREDERYEDWLAVMQPIFHEAGIASLVSGDRSMLAKSFRKLGAGHKVSISILTSLFSKLQKHSLVVMDEPENHLHPNLLSSTIHALRAMLNITGSYAIISTHSPIVVQETPARCIHVLSNSQGYARISRLELESLGTSLDTLASNIFGIHTEMPDYRLVFRELARQGFSLAEVNQLLGRELSIEAASYFASMGGKL